MTRQLQHLYGKHFLSVTYLHCALSPYESHAVTRFSKYIQKGLPNNYYIVNTRRTFWSDLFLSNP